MQNEFIALLPEGARVIADSGYTGKSDLEKRIFAVCNTFDMAAVKQFKKLPRAHQESLSKYKCFIPL